MSRRLVVLDSEAVQALQNPAHPKHRRVLSHVQLVAGRKRRAEVVELAVPTSVRVEAGWDRTSPAWAFPNRLLIADVPLDRALADQAAGIGLRHRVSVADAHLGAIVKLADAAGITVLTSDPRDMRRIAEDADVTIVTV